MHQYVIWYLHIHKKAVLIYLFGYKSLLIIVLNIYDFVFFLNIKSIYTELLK